MTFAWVCCMQTQVDSASILMPLSAQQLSCWATAKDLNAA